MTFMFSPCKPCCCATVLTSSEIHAFIRSTKTTYPVHDIYSNMYLTITEGVGYTGTRTFYFGYDDLSEHTVKLNCGPVATIFNSCMTVPDQESIVVLSDPTEVVADWVSAPCLDGDFIIKFAQRCLYPNLIDGQATSPPSLCVRMVNIYRGDGQVVIPGPTDTSIPFILPWNSPDHYRSIREEFLNSAIDNDKSGYSISVRKDTTDWVLEINYLNRGTFGYILSPVLAVFRCADFDSKKMNVFTLDSITSGTFIDGIGGALPSDLHAYVEPWCLAPCASVDIAAAQKYIDLESRPICGQLSDTPGTLTTTIESSSVDFDGFSIDLNLGVSTSLFSSTGATWRNTYDFGEMDTLLQSVSYGGAWYSGRVRVFGIFEVISSYDALGVKTLQGFIRFDLRLIEMGIPLYGYGSSSYCSAELVLSSCSPLVADAATLTPIIADISGNCGAIYIPSFGSYYYVDLFNGITFRFHLSE